MLRGLKMTLTASHPARVTAIKVSRMRVAKATNSTRRTNRLLGPLVLQHGGCQAMQTLLVVPIHARSLAAVQRICPVAA